MKCHEFGASDSVFDPILHKQHCDEYNIADAGLMLSYDPK